MAIDDIDLIYLNIEVIKYIYRHIANPEYINLIPPIPDLSIISLLY